MTADVEQPPRDIGSPDRHAPIIEAPLPAPRYSFGGDEFVYCELSQEMSFTANLKAFAICSELRRRSLAGMVEICPSNASYQVASIPTSSIPGGWSSC